MFDLQPRSRLNSKKVLFEFLDYFCEKLDQYTQNHARSVQDIALQISSIIHLSNQQKDVIAVAARYHDVGKCFISHDILNSDRRLNENEMALVKKHPLDSYNILSHLDGFFTKDICLIVLLHHERWNGSVYPCGLRGDHIPLPARIIAVGDVVDAMAKHRPYRAALGIDSALNELQKNKSILYDPDVVDACLELFEGGYKLIN